MLGVGLGSFLQFTVFKLCIACVQINLLVYYTLSVFNFYLTRLFQKFYLFLFPFLLFLFSPGLWPWEVWDLFLNAF